MDNETVITVCLNPAIERVIEVPGFSPGGHLVGRQLSRVPAGKGVNVSRALAGLGVPNIALGFACEDCFEEFEAALENDYTTPQFLKIEGKTRENITIVDPVGQRETHIRVPGAAVPEVKLDRFARKLSLLARKDRYVVFAGSLPTNMTDRQFFQLLEMCLENGARVVLDVTGRLLRQAVDLPLWLVKPNPEELAEMTGETADSEDELVRLGRRLSRTMQHVIVTYGVVGGYLFIDESALIGQVNIEKDRIRSTVGCGEVLTAGFLAARMRGESGMESFRQALAVSTAAAVSVNPGEADLTDIHEFLYEASVEPIEVATGE